MQRPLRVAVLISLLVASAAFAQVQSGNVYGKVTDAQGQVLPGATVTLSGVGAPQVFVTGNDGMFRFLNIAPEKYSLSAELAGFSTVTRTIEVNVARNTDIDLSLSPAMQESIVITAATPIIDVRRTGTAENVTRVELENVPTARDPWVVLQSIPGVLIDRVNVGGNESGQQSYFVSKGVERHQTEWNLDGVTVTETTALGSSGFYYDFDSFEEMNFTTSGADPSVKTPGVRINMVTRRGTNDLRGSGRWFWTDQEFQDEPTVPAEARSYLTQGNSIDNIQEYGAEVGGPLWRDRLWLWGAYGRNDISNLVVDGTFFQQTLLESWNAKLTGQIVANNSGNLFYMWNNKEVEGRGISSSRPPEASSDQSGPGWVWKLEDTHIFTPNFYVTLLAADITNGYRLDPQNGMDIEPYWEGVGDALGRGWRRNYRLYMQDVPQDNYRVDASNFLDLGNSNHELKYGFNYRDAPVESWTIWPGTMSWGEFYRGFSLAALTRPGHPVYGAKYTELYLGDTVLWGNLTLQGGLRYDLQKAQNFASEVPANPIIPDILPAATYPGDERALEWESISPKLGATYALGSSRRTVVRGHYSRYVDQLGSGEVGANNPFYVDQILYYYWDDKNGDKRVQRDEIDFEYGIYSATDIDPNNTGSGRTSAGRIDYDMDPTTTDELSFGIEHEIVPAFSVGLTYTYRLRDNFTWDRFEKTRGAGDFYTAADYERVTNAAGQPLFFTGTLPNGQPYQIPYYRLKTGIRNPVYFVTTNRDGYTQTYNGIELTATKRMTNRWMMRGNVTWNDWRQGVDPEAIQDPSEFLSSTTGDSCFTCDDAIVSSGSASDSWMSARWAAAVNGLYQLPWGVQLGAAATAREGYIVAVHRRERPRSGADRVRYLIGEFGDFRLPDLFQLDLRIGKQFSLPGGVALNLAGDLFNATNERNVLGRGWEFAADPSGGGPNPTNYRIQDLQSPRIWRFSARVSF